MTRLDELLKERYGYAPGPPLSERRTLNPEITLPPDQRLDPNYRFPGFPPLNIPKYESKYIPYYLDKNSPKFKKPWYITLENKLDQSVEIYNLLTQRLPLLNEMITGPYNKVKRLIGETQAFLGAFKKYTIRDYANIAGNPEVLLVPPITTILGSSLTNKIRTGIITKYKNFDQKAVNYVKGLFNKKDPNRPKFDKFSIKPDLSQKELPKLKLPEIDIPLGKVHTKGKKKGNSLNSISTIQRDKDGNPTGLRKFIKGNGREYIYTPDKLIDFDLGVDMYWSIRIEYKGTGEGKLPPFKCKNGLLLVDSFSYSKPTIQSKDFTFYNFTLNIPYNNTLDTDLNINVIDDSSRSLYHWLDKYIKKIFDPVKRIVLPYKSVTWHIWIYKYNKQWKLDETIGLIGVLQDPKLEVNGDGSRSDLSYSLKFNIVGELLPE